VNIDLLPLTLYTIIVILLICSLLVVSSFLGQKRKDHATHDVYESGVLPTGSAQARIHVPFYRTAILFIIFDLEVAFLFAWAMSIRESGWLGYIEVSVFILILVTGLLYLYKSGALEWRTQRQIRDVAKLQGEGGVVNIGRNKIASGHSVLSDDSHQVSDQHSGAAH
jgi:NADH-quinone oxidoreductase subunit A